MKTGEVARQGARAEALVAGKRMLPALLAALQRYGEVYGPVGKNGSAVFAPVSSAADLALDYATTVLPPKKLLVRPIETLFSVRRQKGFQIREVAPVTDQVIFGLHSCDLAALKLLDKVYLGDFPDPLYRRRREQTLTVAMSCASPPYDNCFCASMGTGPSPSDGYDLLLTDLGDSLLLELGSARGMAAIADLDFRVAPPEAVGQKKKLVDGAIARMPRAIDTDGLPQLMNANFGHPYWTKLKDECLACGNCVLSCPSCYCYNVLDRVGLDTSTVQRTRTWDGCLLLEFAEVHGGNFRKERDARVKQWMYHKLSYWVDQHGSFGCVGCGRCISACPAGIDVTKTVAEIRG